MRVNQRVLYCLFRHVEASRTPTPPSKRRINATWRNRSDAPEIPASLKRSAFVDTSATSPPHNESTLCFWCVWWHHREKCFQNRFVYIFQGTIQSRGERSENLAAAFFSSPDEVDRLVVMTPVFELRPLHLAVLPVSPLRRTLSLNPKWIICGPASSMLH